jgi:hypothetical protein
MGWSSILKNGKDRYVNCYAGIEQYPGEEDFKDLIDLISPSFDILAFPRFNRLDRSKELYSAYYCALENVRLSGFKDIYKGRSLEEINELTKAYSQYPEMISNIKKLVVRSGFFISPKNEHVEPIFENVKQDEV